MSIVVQPTEILAMVADLGAAATLTSYVDTPSPSTGTVARVATDYPVQATGPQPYDLRYAAGGLTEEGDAQTFVAASGLAVVPRAGDEMTIGADVWTVVGVSKVPVGNTAGVPVIGLYGLHLRGQTS